MFGTQMKIRYILLLYEKDKLLMLIVRTSFYGEWRTTGFVRVIDLFRI